MDYFTETDIVKVTALVVIGEDKTSPTSPVMTRTVIPTTFPFQCYFPTTPIHMTTKIWACSLACRSQFDLGSLLPTEITVKPLIWYAPNPKTYMILFSTCSCPCPIHWRQVLSRDWRCSWSSADRWCSNYIWEINNFIAPLRWVLY